MTESVQVIPRNVRVVISLDAYYKLKKNINECSTKIQEDIISCIESEAKDNHKLQKHRLCEIVVKHFESSAFPW